MAQYMPIIISAVQFSTAAVKLNSRASSGSTATYLLQRRPRLAQLPTGSEANQ